MNSAKGRNEKFTKKKSFQSAATTTNGRTRYASAGDAKGTWTVGIEKAQIGIGTVGHQETHWGTGEGTARSGKRCNAREYDGGGTVNATGKFTNSKKAMIF